MHHLMSCAICSLRLPDDIRAGSGGLARVLCAGSVSVRVLCAHKHAALHGGRACGQRARGGSPAPLAPTHSPSPPVSRGKDESGEGRLLRVGFEKLRCWARKESGGSPAPCRLTRSPSPPLLTAYARAAQRQARVVADLRRRFPHVRRPARARSARVLSRGAGRRLTSG